MPSHVGGSSSAWLRAADWDPVPVASRRDVVGAGIRTALIASVWCLWRRGCRGRRSPFRTSDLARKTRLALGVKEPRATGSSMVPQTRRPGSVDQWFGPKEVHLCLIDRSRFRSSARSTKPVAYLRSPQSASCAVPVRPSGGPFTVVREDTLRVGRGRREVAGMPGGDTCVREVVRHRSLLL